MNLGDRAQVSAEMLIVTAAVLAIAFLLVKGLGETAAQGVSKMNSTTKKILNELDRIAK